MDHTTIPPSVIRQPPLPTRCRRRVAINDSNMLISKRTMLSGVSYLNSRTRRKRKRETNIESLPDELLFDILVNLPADFLHDRAKLVCRRWYNIIHSHAFIDTHIQQYSTYGLVLSSSANNDPHSIHVTATQCGRTEVFELMSYISMATSCNGLSLELRFDFTNLKALSLHVINPATLKSFRLPSVCDGNFEVYRERCGIAYCASSKEYKVTLPYSSVEHGRVQYCLDIVTVGVDKSWRRVEIPPLPTYVREILAWRPPLTIGGFLHWVSASGFFCLTMNVETEMITMSEPPTPRDQHFRYSYYYLSTGRYLSLLVGRRGEFVWEVWEMKSGEWRKAGLPIIDLEAKKWWLLQQEFIVEEYYKCMFPVGWVKYPKVLAFCFAGLEQTYISYNLETREINAIDLPYHPCHDYRAIVHRSSMVWLSQ